MRRTLRLTGRAAVALACAALVALAASFGALAYFASAGEGAGSVTVGTLNAPTGVTASASGSTVTVSWTAPADGVTPEGYVVTRTDTSDSSTAQACGTTPPPAPTFAVSPCDDTSVPVGTYIYTVTAVYHSWTAASVPSAEVSVTASPTIVTTPSAGVTVGGDVHDQATLVGASSPTGDIVFSLYSDAGCSTQVFSSSNAIGGASATSDDFRTTATGTYYWKASYVGDANNEGFTTTCGGSGDEQVVVSAATPSISTTPSPDVVVGGNVSDQASLTGAYNPTGNIVFTLYADNGCSTQVFTSSNAIGGASATSDDFTTTAAGTYYWKTSYAGDANNAPVTSGCGVVHETVVVSQASPTLSLTGPGSPGSGTAGVAVSASSIAATLASGVGETGTVTFTYFQQASAPGSCASGGTPIGTSSVSGNGSYHPAAGFTPLVAGNYWLYASYGGDGNNDAAASACPPGAAQEIVVAQASPSLSLAGPGSPGSGTAGVAVSASSLTATLASGVGATGTVTFTYFQQASAPSSCSSGGTTIGTTSVSGNASYHPAAGFTPLGAGNYWLYASYAGDGNNNAAVSACPPGAAQEIVVTQASPTLSVAAPATATAGTAISATSITATLGSSSGANATSAITFMVFGPQMSAPTTCTSGGTTVGSATPAGNGTYASNAAFTPATAGTYWWYASSPADANNNAAASLCSASMTKTVVSSVPIGGLILSNITTDATPPVICSGAAGSVVCTSLNEPNNSPDILVAKLTLTDSSGAVVTNTSGSAITIDLAMTGNGSVSPTALSVPNGLSETSGAFILTRAMGNNKTVVLTATVHGTSQTLKVTLSS